MSNMLYGVMFWDNSADSKKVLNIPKALQRESVVGNYLRNLIYFLLPPSSCSYNMINFQIQMYKNNHKT